MKIAFSLLTAACLCLGCHSDSPGTPDTGNLIGTWQLTEVLFDPGDGSGVFQPSDAGFEITLKPDGTFQANYHVCRVFESGNRESGPYSRIGDQEILITCDGSFANGIQGRLEEGNLIFYYPCIEPCVYKFRKLSDFTE